MKKIKEVAEPVDGDFSSGTVIDNGMELTNPGNPRSKVSYSKARSEYTPWKTRSRRMYNQVDCCPVTKRNGTEATTTVEDSTNNVPKYMYNLHSGTTS